MSCRQPSSAATIWLRCGLLHGDERIVVRNRPTFGTDLSGEQFDLSHHRVGVGKNLVLQPQRMHLVHPLGERPPDRGAHERLHERAIEGQIDVRHARGGRETALVGRIVAAHRADVVERPLLTAHHPVAGHEIGARRVRGLGIEHRLIETGRQRIDQVDVAGELAVLFLRDSSGDEDAEVADGLVDRIDDGLAVGTNLVDVLV